jgi:hypothetical protein
VPFPELAAQDVAQELAGRIARQLVAYEIKRAGGVEFRVE